MPPILNTLTSHSDSDFECLNIRFKKENNLDDLNSNGFDYCFRKDERKLYGLQQTDHSMSEVNEWHSLDQIALLPTHHFNI